MLVLFSINLIDLVDANLIVETLFLDYMVFSIGDNFNMFIAVL